MSNLIKRMYSATGGRIKSFVDYDLSSDTKVTIIGLSILAGLIGAGAYYTRDQEINNPTVATITREMNYCGEFGEIDCYNPEYTFRGIEGCFEDKSLSGCYNFEDGEKLILQKGEQVKTVTYRNPILPPWGCYVITEISPSKEELAGKPTLGDRFFCCSIGNF